jgi:hypothetical protein
MFCRIRALSTRQIPSAKLPSKNSELKILVPSTTINEAAADDDDHHSAYEWIRWTTKSSGSFDDAPHQCLCKSSGSLPTFGISIFIFA